LNSRLVRLMMLIFVLLIENQLRSDQSRGSPISKRSTIMFIYNFCVSRLYF
jgi:hypothetical protein